MNMSDLPWDGGCRCGKVRFRITQPPLVTAACHCRGCQRMTASAFSTTLTLPPDAMELTQGQTVIGGMHGGLANGEHHHCDWCKSWLFTRVPADFHAINVRATMLDDAGWFVPYMETYTEAALSWALTGAVESFATFPDASDYPRIMAAFAASN